jgi:hypothetical protein
MKKWRLPSWCSGRVGAGVMPGAKGSEVMVAIVSLAIGTEVRKVVGKRACRWRAVD